MLMIRYINHVLNVVVLCCVMYARTILLHNARYNSLLTRTCCMQTDSLQPKESRKRLSFAPENPTPKKRPAVEQPVTPPHIATSGAVAEVCLFKHLSHTTCVPNLSVHAGLHHAMLCRKLSCWGAQATWDSRYLGLSYLGLYPSLNLYTKYAWLAIWCT